MRLATAEEMVADFQEKFETPKDLDLWIGLIEEEHKEVREAIQHLHKELADLMYVTVGFLNLFKDPNDIEGDKDKFQKAYDITMDTERLLNTLLDDNVADEVLRRVHESNMSKLCDDGKPLRREDGKILKGPNYKPPSFDDLL